MRPRPCFPACSRCFSRSAAALADTSANSFTMALSDSFSVFASMRVAFA
jgi:hypothetical protein